MALRAQLEFLTGDRAGQTTDLTGDYITFGRHPMCTVAFDAEQDLEVSGRHAALMRTGELFLLRDLGSTNGTFINGHRLHDDHVVATLDEVQFGMRGPRLRLHLAADPPAPLPLTAAPSPRHYSSIPPRRTKEESSPDGAPAAAPGTATRIRAATAGLTTGPRRAIALLVVAVVVVVVAVVLSVAFRTRDRGVEAERRLLLARVDGLLTELTSMGGRLENLQATLDSGHAEMSRLRDAIRRETSPENFERLRLETQATIQREEHFLAAAGALDLRGIAAASQPAVALIVVETADGKAFTGTGFAVASDTDGGFILTNKHVLQDPSGARPRRVGVVFHGSGQTFQATMAGVHPTQDAALLRVEVHGGVPVVETDDHPQAPGAPVAVIGFPLGVDLPMGGAWQRVGVSSTIMAGTVTRTAPGFLQIDGYGAEGSSGSPIFDAAGRAIGFLYGGREGAEGRILYALPIDVGLELLRGGPSAE